MPARVSMMFAGFKSLWTIPWAMRMVECVSNLDGPGARPNRAAAHLA